MEKEIYEHFYRAEERHWWFRARRRVIASVLEDRFPRRDLAIADLGCGTGGMFGLLSRFGTVTGVDEAPEARDFCARRGFTRVLTPGEWQGGSDRYDLVTSFDVVEHVDDDVAFLASMRDRLKPGGTVLVTVPAHAFLWSTFDEMNHHKRRYSRTGLVTALEAAGLVVRRATYFNTFLFPPIAAVRLAERGLRRDPTDPEAKKRALGRWFRVGPLNPVLEGLFASERHLLRRFDLPTGCSILALAEARP